MGSRADQKHLVVVVLLLAMPCPASPDPALPGPLIGMEFVEIPGGPFLLCSFDEEGTPAGERIETLVATFQIMTTEVTQAQWQEVMGGDVYRCLTDSGVTGIGPDHPMTRITAYDCQRFMDSLNSIDPCWIYRFPTEYEWAVAYGAGPDTPWFRGLDTASTGACFAWFDSTAGGSLHPVASLEPNLQGLYDIAGNVAEWCLHGEGRLLTGIDPASGDSACFMLLSGGAWNRGVRYCRCDGSRVMSVSYSGPETGLRLVREPAPVPYDPGGEHRFAVYAEPAVSIGGVSHTFPDDDIEQFGYDVDGGCEQDAGYFRVGLGKHLGRLSAFVFGEVGHLGPGVLFDNHGPYILPEVLLRMNELTGGLDIRYVPFRVTVGWGSYTGEAEVDYDTVGIWPAGSWNTDIVDGRGWHFSAGICAPVSQFGSCGLEWSQHFIELRLGDSGTGAEPTMHDVKQYEVRFFVNLQLPFEPRDLLRVF